MSYMKVGKSSFFFFDPTDVESIHRAFDAAMKTRQKVSIFSPPVISGPWDKLQIIGHRPRAAIMAELQIAETDEEVASLNAELDALAERFTNVGRRLPLQAAA